MTVRVDYAGLGGVCHGLRALGIEPVGIEWMAAACRSRALSGLPTIRADLATYRQPSHVRLAGYWGSPPCQTFSAAGNGDGMAQLDDLLDVIHSERWADADRFDDRTRHVIDSARCAAMLGAEWVGMEQVPAVLPLWRALAHVLERHGYSTWTGVLCAADYGVPQTRRRAFLLASRARRVAPPVPTHSERPGMFGELPWVSMADALGWGFDGESATTVTAGGTGGGGSPEPFGYAGYGQVRPRVKRERSGDRADEWFDPVGPSQTLTSKARSWDVLDLDPDGPVRLTAADALVLQGFPPDLPVLGSRSEQFTQVGNAVPPPMAAHIVAALTGRTLEEAA